MEQAPHEVITTRAMEARCGNQALQISLRMQHQRLSLRQKHPVPWFLRIRSALPRSTPVRLQCYRSIVIEHRPRRAKGLHRSFKCSARRSRSRNMSTCEIEQTRLPICMTLILNDAKYAHQVFKTRMMRNASNYDGAPNQSSIGRLSHDQS